VTRTILAATLVLAGIAAGPAAAQFDPGPGFDRGPPSGFDGPRHRRGPFEDEGFGQRRRFGRICVTSRGNCPVAPAPLNTPCGCQIPGFGPKRGAIGF
jgi:hypothetical protein